MRPVTRGAAPRVYTAYQDAIGDLEDRLGLYCSYCERRLPVSLAVEHVVPKSIDPALRTTWDNFLLGCVNCNSAKGDQPTDGETFLWPDRDNTFRAFLYHKGGFVGLAEGLNADAEARAVRLRDVVGLDRHGAEGFPAPARRDRRWQQREEVWALAERTREILNGMDTPQAQELIIAAAIGYGFFSVWMTVFADHNAIRNRLAQQFTGTAADCFDANGEPVARPNGRL